MTNGCATAPPHSARGRFRQLFNRARCQRQHKLTYPTSSLYLPTRPSSQSTPYTATRSHPFSTPTAGRRTTFVAFTMGSSPAKLATKVPGFGVRTSEGPLPKIAVIGGTGRMGVHLCAAWANAGYDVTMCSRTEDKAQTIVDSLLAGDGYHEDGMQGGIQVPPSPDTSG